MNPSRWAPDETLTTGLAVKYYAGKALEDKSKKTQLHTHTHTLTTTLVVSFCEFGVPVKVYNCGNPTRSVGTCVFGNTVGDDNPRLSQPYERPKLSENVIWDGSDSVSL